MSLKQTDWMVLALFLSGALVWALTHLLAPSTLAVRVWRPPVTKVYHVQNTLDLNQATIEELVALPDIGPVLAQRILDYRTEHGYFRAIEELDAVPGIGPKTLEKLRPYLRIAPTDEDQK
jgi:comEA protein